jgi:hypothetical protein
MNNESPKFCKDCKWMVQKSATALTECSCPSIGHTLNLVTGIREPEMGLCCSQRSETMVEVIKRYGLCGPDASFFEAKP